MWGPGRPTHPTGGKAGKRLRSCAVLPGAESAGAPSARGRLLRMRTALARLWRGEFQPPGSLSTAASPGGLGSDGAAGRAGPAAAGGRRSGGRAG